MSFKAENLTENMSTTVLHDTYLWKVFLSLHSVNVGN